MNILIGPLSAERDESISDAIEQGLTESRVGVIRQASEKARRVRSLCAEQKNRGDLARFLQTNRDTLA